MELNKETVQRHLAELRQTMQPWMTRWVNEFSPALRPAEHPTSHVVQRMNSTTVQGDTKTQRQTWTQYNSPFIPQSTWNLQTRLTRAGTKIELPLTSEPEQQEKSSNEEMFLHGVIADQDRQYKRMWGTTFLARAASFLAPTAKVAGVVTVTKRGETAEIRWDLWDPTTVLHDFGRRNYRRIVHETLEDLDVVEDLLRQHASTTDETGNTTYPLPSKWNDYKKQEQEGKAPVVAVADYYCEEIAPAGKVTVWHCILVDGEAMTEPKPNGWDKLSIFWGVANGGAATYQHASIGGPQNQSHTTATQPQYVANHALPWFEPLTSTNTIGIYNDAKSLELDALWESVHPVKVVTVKDDGNYVLASESWGPDVTITVPEGIAIAYLTKPPISLDQFSVIRTAEEDMNRAYSKVLHGQEAFAGQSGIHLHDQQDISELIAVPYAETLSGFLAEMAEETVRQFIKLGGKIRLNAKHQSGERLGTEWERDFEAKDLPPAGRVRIKLSPQLPHDDARTVDIFQRSTQSELEDRVLARGRAGIDDPLGVERRVKRQRLEDRVEMQNLDLLASLRLKVQEAERRAKEAPNQLERMNARIDVAIAKRELAALTQTLLGAPQTGQTDPAQAGNFAPGTLPTQAAVDSPQRQLLANGQPTTGMNGRGPGTQEVA